ncbi:MAG: preprotein translocase subunit SecA [Patescibacteria group bacterium]|nr:preprotein translocase subunit SecA [Patescibacteria group bacterium]
MAAIDSALTKKLNKKMEVTAMAADLQIMASLFTKIFPDRTLKRLEGVISLINGFEPEIQKLDNNELKKKSEELKKEIRGVQETQQDILNERLPEAFALIREASKRTLDQRHFDVQLIGGAVLHEGKIAEMLTGEGKTLAATLPAYLNALTGYGVHVVTVNDYLAKRDTVWMGQVYHALGLKVTCLLHDASYQYDPTFESSELDKERDATGNFKVVDKFLRPISRKEAYAADITYGTNHEFGFDFLRDNLTLRLEDRVQRLYNYAIIDEVDSILIDEARTPLIIAAPDTESSGFYKTFARIVEHLNKEEDYLVDEKMRSVNITDAGISKVEKMIGVQNIFDPENSRLVHFLQESLKAKALFRRDKDYVVKDGEIIIVDEFTGRMLHGRRYSGGLHQAIEAKEGVFVKEENRTYAQITIQNYFRLYKKIAGMTGTAQTSAEEFHKVYNLEVVSIPPNKPMIRKDLQDSIYKTKEAKYKAVVKEIEERHKKGQPILLGTASISNNEIISSYLKEANVPHEVLNAKNHEREGAIIAQAGRVGAVTVATNMAGRGVDIILGGNPINKEEAQKVRELGGLHVIGTERHEARRIDNQLRGRSGRQGDPGSSQFYLSLEDDLVRIFGGDRIKGLMETLNFPEDIPIESGFVTKAVNEAQRKVEGANFDIRKHLLDFDDVLNKQRTAIYRKREELLKAGESNTILPIVSEALNNYVENIEKQNEANIDEEVQKKLKEARAILGKIPESIEKERGIMLSQHAVRILDMLWVEHLENLEGLRDSVNIRAYGQHEPLVEYRREGHILYQNLNLNFEALLFNTVFPIFEIDLVKLKTSSSAPKTPPPKEAKNIGRNDPCWCGARDKNGHPIKYKKCHGK